ncbi:MAG: sigma-E factor regulatory protein RseB domain-containing protein, partial [Armatimonadota bacterium]
MSEVLHRAEQAEKLVSYRGVKYATVRCCEEDEIRFKMSVIHLKPDKTRVTYLAPSTLAGMVTVRNGSRRWQYYPQQERWVSCHRCLGPNDFRVSTQVLHNYKVRITGTERVAGREAYVVNAVPKLGSEPTHRIWIDKQRYIVVGTETKTGDGRVIRSSRFLSLALDPRDIKLSLFQVRGDTGSVSKNGGRIGFRVLKPSYLPAGYKLVGASTSSVNGHACSHLQFSNGVNTVSLFQRQAGKTSQEYVFLSKVTNVLSWVKNGMHFTLLGDLA